MTNSWIKAERNSPPYPNGKEPSLIAHRENPTFLPTQPIPDRRFIRSRELHHVGPEGMFATVRALLAEERFEIPPTNRLTHTPEQNATVVIASGNSIKTERLMEILSSVGDGGIKVVRVPEAKESHTLDSIKDAYSKAYSAHDFLQETTDESRRVVRQEPHVIIANDEVKRIPVLARESDTQALTLQFASLGKPKSENRDDPRESIRETFERLDALAYKYDWPYVPYIDELTTVIHNPAHPDENALSVQRSVVFLSREGVHQIAHGKFDEYIAEANKVLAGLANPDHGENATKPDITSIAGGLELQALINMGVVRFITGTASEVNLYKGFPQQRDKAKEHAYNLAKGHTDERLIRAYFTSDAN